MTIAKEYVEPGKSAISIDKRPVFRDVIHALKEFKCQGFPIKYIIVYMMSHTFREELRRHRRGRCCVGCLTAIFNELQVRMSSEEIKTKIANSARNDSTIGRAPLG